MGDDQQKTALLLGATGAGAAAAHALAFAGTCRLVLLDDAPVTPADLVSTPLLPEQEAGAPAGEALARALRRLFPALEVTARPAPAGDEEARSLAAGAAIVVETTGRYPDMFLANDAACAAGIPLVHAALLGHLAQLLTVVPGTGACLRCIFEGPPPPVAPAPAAAEPLGPLAGFIGALLGVEAVRLLAGEPGQYAGRVTGYEARSGWSRAVVARARAGCPACGARQPPPAAEPGPAEPPPPAPAGGAA